MQGKIENMSKEYALVKLPDGRTMNVKLENLIDNPTKGREVDLKGDFPPMME